MLSVLRGLGGRRDGEEPVEALDLETLLGRIGGPPSEKAAPASRSDGYTRSDGRTTDGERSWRRVAGLTR